MSSILLPKNSTIELVELTNIMAELLVIQPTVAVVGVALVFHPLPIAGGTNLNKVVQTIAKTLVAKGYIVYCPNFRGVGKSSGEFDNGVGELVDSFELYQLIRDKHQGLPMVLAGFSFGASMAGRLSEKIISELQALVLFAPSVINYDFSVIDKSKTIIVYGQNDEVIDMGAVYQWADQQKVMLHVFANTGHYFHGKLVELSQSLERLLYGVIRI